MKTFFQLHQYCLKFIIGKFNHVIQDISSLRTAFTNIILACSLHDCALAENKKCQKYYQQIDYCTNDSMLLTWYFRKKTKKNIDRIYGPDLMKKILEKENKIQSRDVHLFLCPSTSSKREMQKAVAKNYPNIVSQFVSVPQNIHQFDKKKWLETYASNHLKFVWIGIGSPQQVVLASHIKQLTHSSTIFCVGAAFDFLTGDKRQAPLLFQQTGLEWLFRLLTEPQRLWKRYLYVIPKFLIKKLLGRFF